MMTMTLASFIIILGMILILVLVVPGQEENHVIGHA